MTNKEKLLAFSALAILLTSGFPAMARDGDDDTPPPMGDERPMKSDDDSRGFGDGPRGKGGPDGDKRGAEMFAKADKDGDGFLTKDEMLEAHKVRLDDMFAKADKDGDSKLSRDEMRAAHQEMRAKFKDRMKNVKERREEMREKYGKKDGSGRERFSDDSANDSGRDD